MLDIPSFVFFVVCITSFLPLLVVLIIQLIKFIQTKKIRTNRCVTHFVLLLTVMCAIIDYASRMGWLLNPVSDTSLNSLCYMPDVFTWYFLFTAYILALYNWVTAYNTMLGRTLTPFKIMFILLDAVTFGLLMISGSFFCTQASQNSDATGYLTRIGNIIYLAVLCMTAILLSFGFLIYGGKIVWNLRQIHKTARGDSTKPDTHLYKVTYQTVLLSLTTFVGALIAVVLYVSDNYYIGSYASDSVQLVCKVMLTAEMMYTARPRALPLSHRPQFAHLNSSSNTSINTDVPLKKSKEITITTTSTTSTTPATTPRTVE